MSARICLDMFLFYSAGTNEGQLMLRIIILGHTRIKQHAHTFAYSMGICSSQTKTVYCDRIELTFNLRGTHREKIAGICFVNKTTFQNTQMPINQQVYSFGVYSTKTKTRKTKYERNPSIQSSLYGKPLFRSLLIKLNGFQHTLHILRSFGGVIGGLFIQYHISFFAYFFCVCIRSPTGVTTVHIANLATHQVEP